eukprot:scaffold70126_cov67-Phaeocystis_antarctica.AAC.2
MCVPFNPPLPDRQKASTLLLTSLAVHQAKWSASPSALPAATAGPKLASGALIRGKVHGSLARAGKVRGQTPKVAKGEKTGQRLTGRAKKRLQYNRRFVNVVVGPGKKKGPNTQPLGKCGGRCSSRPLATLTTCNGDLDADTHGVILSPAVPSPPPLPLSRPPNYTRETGCGPPRPSLPTPTLPTPTFRFPSRLDVARFTHAPTHSSPRSRAARHAYAPACLCTSQPLTRPHLNLADSCGAVCAAARRSVVAAAASPLFDPSSLSHSPTAGLREFVGLWSYHRHVARISRGRGTFNKFTDLLQFHETLHTPNLDPERNERENGCALRPPGVGRRRRQARRSHTRHATGLRPQPPGPSDSVNRNNVKL